MDPGLKGGGRKSFPGPMLVALDRGVEVFCFRDPVPGLAPCGFCFCCFSSASSSQISPSSSSPSSRGEPQLSLGSIPSATHYTSTSESSFHFNVNLIVSDLRVHTVKQLDLSLRLSEEGKKRERQMHRSLARSPHSCSASIRRRELSRYFRVSTSGNDLTLGEHLTLARFTCVHFLSLECTHHGPNFFFIFIFYVK